MIISALNSSSSNPNKKYTVVLNTATAEASCDCPGWTFKKGDKPRSCKHTVAILKSNGLVANTSSEEVVKIPTGSPAGEPLVAPSVVVIGTSDVQPMLASSIPANTTIKSYSNDDWLMQEKIDGHRLLVTVSPAGVSARSRPSASHASNVRSLPDHIRTAAMELMPGIYDTELYLPGGTSSDVTRIDKQSELVLAVFDVIEITGVPMINRPLTERMSFLQDSTDLAELTSSTPIRIVKSVPVSQTEINGIWARGGEGAILKRKDSAYESGARSLSWIKIKKILSATLTITGFTAGKLGPFSTINLKDDDGNETTVKTLNNEMLADIAKQGSDAYIGRKLVIEHQGRTAKGVYRHPMFDHIL
jgi:ATP-dependent DNA ligase